MSHEDFFTAEEIHNLRCITLEELRELTRDLESLLPRLRKPAGAGGAAEKLSRIFHTVGGSAALVGFEAISDAGSELEALMGNLARNGSFEPALIDEISAKAGDLKRRIEEKNSSQ